MLSPSHIAAFGFFPFETLIVVLPFILSAALIWAGVRQMMGGTIDGTRKDNIENTHDIDHIERLSEFAAEFQTVTYYTINHRSWERSRLANHNCWVAREARIIGTCENAWIKLPKGSDLDLEFYAEVFEQDGETFMVKLNGEPLSPSERLSWQHLNPEPLGSIFNVGEFEIQCHDCDDRDLPMTIIGPNLEGEHILKDKGGYPNSIGSGEACSIRLPDPKLPEYMAEIVPMSNHRMLYAPDGEFIMRVDLYHFEFAGYLIFQRRNPSNRGQKSAALAFLNVSRRS